MGNMWRYYWLPKCARPCLFADHYFEAVSAVKLLQYVIASTDLKGFSYFLYTLYSVPMISWQFYYKFINYIELTYKTRFTTLFFWINPSQTNVESANIHDVTIELQRTLNFANTSRYYSILSVPGNSCNLQVTQNVNLCCEATKIPVHDAFS